MTNEKAPERIWLSPASFAYRTSPAPTYIYSETEREPQDIEYVRADLLAIANKKDTEIAQGIVREWAEHDMNEHYNSDYLRDEFGSEHLEQRIATALATVRAEERKAALKDAAVIASDFRRLDQDTLWARYKTLTLETALLETAEK